MNDWRSQELTEAYLTGVRGAIPLAQVQIEIIHELISKWKPDFSNFLDLGCGDGILGQSLFGLNPQATGIFLDFSQPMLKQARLKPTSGVCHFVTQDYSAPNWAESIGQYAPLDLVISGFSIHHLEDDQKIRVYQDLLGLLKPGGLFLNLEHVSSRSRTIEKTFDGFFVNHMVDYHQKHNTNKSREEIEHEYYHRDDKVLNKLAPVETQCQWLRDIGFRNVDCYFKVFELALFGGSSPNDNQ